MRCLDPTECVSLLNPIKDHMWWIIPILQTWKLRFKKKRAGIGLQVYDFELTFLGNTPSSQSKAGPSLLSQHCGQNLCVAVSANTCSQLLHLKDRAWADWAEYLARSSV